MTKTEISVVRLELCKELFEVSGWRDTSRYWYQDWLLQNAWRVTSLGVPSVETYPAYDLGYLLRKLPPEVNADHFRMVRYGEEWIVGYHDGDIFSYFVEQTDTPEDAVCTLAINLFKEGVLKREETQ